MPDTTANENIPDCGVYTLLIRLRKTADIRIRKHTHRLQRGYYIYTGRAMQHLTQRLQRHLRQEKRLHWHIDRLLVHGRIVDIQVEPGTRPARECEVARYVNRFPGAETVTGFGASDCDCNSHLNFFQHRPAFSLHAAAPLTPRLNTLYKQLATSYRDQTLDRRDPFRTLVSCVLSLRTRDPVTDKATERLFAEIQGPDDLIRTTAPRIAELIYPVGMYRQKSQRLISIAHILRQEHNGAVPADIDSLTRLPGVGRKTATLVRSFAYHIPAVCVDTHVHRISNRLGLIRTTSPEDSEQALMDILPTEYWSRTNPLLVQHGQQICKPVTPLCEQCMLQQHCAIDRIRREHCILHSLGFRYGHPALKLDKDMKTERTTAVNSHGNALRSS